MQRSMTRKLFLALLGGMLALGLAACEDEQGPAEKAGEQVDQAVEDAGEGVEEMGDAIEDTSEGN